MTTRQIKHMFIEACYDGDRGAYLRARRADYLKVQFEWSCFVDALCKDGTITQRQYDRALF